MIGTRDFGSTVLLETRVQGLAHLPNMYQVVPICSDTIFCLSYFFTPNFCLCFYIQITPPNSDITLAKFFHLFSELYCNISCITLYYTIMYYTVLHCTVLYCIILQYTTMYYNISYSTTLYCTTIYHIM